LEAKNTSPVNQTLRYRVVRFRQFSL